MKNTLDQNPNIPEIQREVLDFWKEDKTFEKSIKTKKGSEMVFYDGPPFPTGIPHHGTVFVSFIKDMIARYFTMQGHPIERKWGWDCHGLPIEVQAEGRLGLESKLEIENKVGVAKFNDTCREIVSQNNDAWRQYVEEMARWVDYENAYKTMNTPFMESVIWAFKELYNKGLIYKDYRVTPYCPRCETALSISETREDNATRPRQDRWTIARFETKEVVDECKVYFLAWTTTPWTLPSNMALAVNEQFDYAYVKVGKGEVYVAGKNSLSSFKNIFGEKPEIIRVVKGSELVGKTYKPLFDCFENKKDEGAFRVIGADFVAEGEGVCIVHIAPAFGEDDYWACKKNGVPLVCPVNEKGRFTSEVKLLEGKLVFDANSDVVRYLKENNLYVADGSLVHNYPHCWRCSTPLIYKAMDAWYFSIDKIKDKLIKKNEKVNWVPDSLKIGRFGNWLNNARDWNISRNRYWSTPIPVWECPHCGKVKVAGSIKEIEELGNVKVDNLHKQFLDKITFKCECGHEMKRVSEVLDCWFESGSVPFARLHYPFENKAWFEKNTSSDFVIEYPGQIRCWFYYLHVLSVALFDKPAYKNCIVHGTILDHEGKKLSKKSKNYTDPMKLMKTYGTDAFRLYMFSSAAMLAKDMVFDDNGLKEKIQQVILPLWNCACFYQSYSKIDGFVGSEQDKFKPVNSLDKWILAKLYNVENTIKDNMDHYQIDKYVDPIVDFVDSLSNWYIRRSRRRFWASGLDEQKRSGYQTLYYVLTNFCKIVAPVMPIIAEKIYKSLTNKESVHLEDWPRIDKKFRNDELLKEVELAQDVIHLARGIRNKNNIKNRQPLSLLEVAFTDPQDYVIVEKYLDIIKEELNVKEVKLIEKVDEIACVEYKVNFSTVGKTMGSKIPQITRAIRNGELKLKDGKYHVDDIVLNKEDILISYKAKNDMPVLSNDEIIVALDLTITDELRQEGAVREIIRNIQDARKQLGLDIMDRIYIDLEGEIEQKYVDVILKETLGESKKLSLKDAAAKLEVEDVKIRIKKKD